MQLGQSIKVLAAATLLAHAAAGHTMEWSDNSIGVKVGDRFSEPGIAPAIRKTIYEFVHVSGDKLGKNLLVGQVLQSDGNDPAAGGTAGAQEFFGFYRRSFSLSKLSGSSMAFGPVKDVSLVGRFDRGTKNITFAPAARKLMAGVALDFAVPKGYAEATFYAYNEKNYNGIMGQEVNFDTTLRTDLNWGIPFSLGIPLEWRGGLAVTGKKGNDGFGSATKTETRLYTELLMPVGAMPGLMVGVAYEMWRNKYGANQKTVPGAKQDTALLVAEYHF
ncbi:MAG TPA: hypothetical protein VLI46_08535 [Ramlibacter sp.]|nr:hypothetical protein [Ramlibacter sp.]